MKAFPCHESSSINQKVGLPQQSRASSVNQPMVIPDDPESSLIREAMKKSQGTTEERVCWDEKWAKAECGRIITRTWIRKLFTKTEHKRGSNTWKFTSFNPISLPHNSHNAAFGTIHPSCRPQQSIR